MNTQQMLLTIGALLLLSFLILRVNSNQILVAETQNNAKYTLVALALASSILEEAKQKAFDKVCFEETGTNGLEEFTEPSALGMDDDDKYPAFNDFDDYAYYNIDNPMINETAAYNSETGKYETFYIYVTVGYVELDNLNEFTEYQTWYKKMEVTVESSSMLQPVKVSTVYGYWFFLTK